MQQQQQQRRTERERIVKLYDRLAEEHPESHESLNHMEKKIVADTPLHDAAAAGETLLAMEYANLKPSLARKLNRHGLSPMHLALLNGHIQTARALLTVDSELIRVKGIDGITPLHHAAEIEETELLMEFLIASPQSVEDLTTRCETIVHIAARKRRLQACKVLLGWLQRFNQEEILGWKDADGNTILHIAASTDQPEVMKLFVGKINNVNAKNNEGYTALDICHSHNPSSEVAEILRRAKAKRSSDISSSSTTYTNYFSASLYFMERRDKLLNFPDRSRANELRNIILIVAVLIAAATYQAVLSPPGGYWQDDSNSATTTTNTFDINSITTDALSPSPSAAGDKKVHYAGQMVMSGAPMGFFVVTNTIAFILSLNTIIIFVVGLPYDATIISVCYFLTITYFYALSNNLPVAPRHKNIVKFVISFLVMLAYWYYTFPLLSVLRCGKRRSLLDPPRKHAKELAGLFGRRYPWEWSLSFRK